MVTAQQAQSTLLFAQLSKTEKTPVSPFVVPTCSHALSVPNQLQLKSTKLLNSLEVADQVCGTIFFGSILRAPSTGLATRAATANGTSSWWMLAKELVSNAVFTLVTTSGRTSSVLLLATATGRTFLCGTPTTMVQPLSVTIRNSVAGKHLPRNNSLATLRDAEWIWTRVISALD